MIPAMEAVDREAREQLLKAGDPAGIDLSGTTVRRTSSRLCLGVEHGDYNGTELFGVGTDRFLWLAYRGCHQSRGKGVRLISANFPEEGVISFDVDTVPPPATGNSQADGPGSNRPMTGWARFVYGAVYVLQQRGFQLTRGIEGVVYGNIPGGGMSRSASLSINLLMAFLEVNGCEISDEFAIVDMAREIENVYIGSPCGLLDHVMIYFARDEMGTHYRPRSRQVEHVPLGSDHEPFQFVVMDTGTTRAGLEHATYADRVAECQSFLRLLQQDGYPIETLAEVRDEATYSEIMDRYRREQPDWCRRLDYLYHAQQRFYEMMTAWKQGDIERVGALFRADGLGLRDDYVISGPELESMCEIARSVPGVLGERMLGGGDKGAAGAIVRTDAVEALSQAVARDYPKRHPEYAQRYGLHVCRQVDGVRVVPLF